MYLLPFEPAAEQFQELEPVGLRCEDGFGEDRGGREANTIRRILPGHHGGGKRNLLGPVRRFLSRRFFLPISAVSVPV
jgi:hypothetical protein